MNYYDTYTGYVQPLPENQNNHASNTYRQYDEYDGSPRQDDLVRYLYKYPSLVCTYDPWTNSVMAPSTSTSPKHEKNKTTNYPNTPLPKSQKSPKSPKSLQSSSSPPPPILVQPQKTEKKEIKTEIKTEEKTEKTEDEKSKSPFSVENIFSSVWDFLKSPF